MDFGEGDDIDERKQDEYLMTRNILLKNYQIKLIEKAKQGNVIIYLPTGAGKTLIAVNVLLSKAKDFTKSINEGGKIAFFISHTKILSYQICQVLQTHTKFKVCCFNGDMNVDSWNRAKWNSHFGKNQVIVLTAEILKQILQMNFIHLSNISLIVFDECHHAAADHPYNLILQFITKSDCSEKPLLIGLTGVLLNSPKNDQISSMIQSLEAAFDGKVITETELEEIMTLATSPTEKFVVYQKWESCDSDVLKMYKDFINRLSDINLKAADCPVIPSEGIDFKCRNKAKRLKNGATLSKLHLEEFGPFCGSLSALFTIILFEKYRLMSDDEIERQLLVFARTELNKIRHLLLKIIGDENDSELILKHSSFKVRWLIQVLLEENAKAKGKHFSSIIFVHQRSTAFVLASLLKRLSVVNEKYSFIKAEFIVGSSVFSKETVSLGCKNEEIVRSFAAQSLNVIIATNVLEEGIDISACNVVISFDFPKNYSSYFQSKGRARNKESTYYVFVEQSEVQKKKWVLDSYRNIGEKLLETICGDFDNEDEDEEDEDLERVEKITIVGKTKSFVVDGITAIKAVNRYCSKLPQDKFSLLSPTTWYIVNEEDEKKAFVQLPVNCPIREVIEGEWREGKKQAKRSSFLATVKKLYEIGELNDDLNIKLFEAKESDFEYLFPHFVKENIDPSSPQPGTKKRKQVYETKFAESLSNCLPMPGVKTYVHVIDLTVDFDPPELERKIAIYNILKIPVTFAILSTKKLNKILRFPLFLDMGRINCDFLVNYDEVILTESEISDIKLCHFALFQKVIKVFKNSQIFDNRNKEHSFYVAPVEKNEEDRFVLNWDIIRLDFCKNNNSALVRYNPSAQPGQKRNLDVFREESFIFNKKTSLVPEKFGWGYLRDENVKKFEFTEAAYKYFIITPNYRNIDPPQCYIVSKLCYDMSPLSPFPRVNYTDYIHYYMDKYSIEITNPNQPLMKVSALYGCSNFNKPKMRKQRRAKEKYKEYDEHLIPELCDVIPFDRKYWVKALLLPTVLNRICHVYCVEEFRRKIIEKTGLGIVELPEDTDWNPLEVDERSIEEEDEEVTNAFANTSFSEKSLQISLPLSKLKNNTKETTKVILDPERNMYECGLCDLEFYVRALKELCSTEEEGGGEEFRQAQIMAQTELEKLASSKKTPPPALTIFQKPKSLFGPDLAMLIQVCTSKSANDIVDYERLETLGDSFLKFAGTLYLFRNIQENEGILTAVKGKLVGNRNLLYCGLNMGVQDVINVTDFVPLSDWNPPLLCVPERLVYEIINNNIDPAVLYWFKISFEEQFSGIVSEATYQKNEEFIRNHDKCWKLPTNSLLPYKSIEDKTISDCVEAFIGAYLLTLGLIGGFEILQFFGILPFQSGSYSKLMKTPYKGDLLESGSDTVVLNLLNQVYYSDLENTLNYSFKNKALLLEALTHPSYSKNRITNSYQRLELLGDAIIDFLITSYIYDSCRHLTPGQVTDIRSALVNNITFACLVARYELYKYLLSFSSSLSEAIKNFVSFQGSRNHVVDDNVLVLLDENDCLMGESIVVPKALGDLFESLAGAIFLDSGNSLETVWKVYYRLMKREIDEFTKTVPKTPVRLLQEICSDKPYYEAKVFKEFSKVSCTVYYENREIKAHGFGANKKEGKRSAAKLVLNKILSLKK